MEQGFIPLDSKTGNNQMAEKIVLNKEVEVLYDVDVLIVG